MAGALTTRPETRGDEYKEDQRCEDRTRHRAVVVYSDSAENRETTMTDVPSLIDHALAHPEQTWEALNQSPIVEVIPSAGHLLDQS